MNPLKKAATTVLSRTPLYSIIEKRAQNGDPVTVLCYHTLGPDDDQMDAWTVLRVQDFRRQLNHLKSKFDIVTMDQAVGAPTSPKPRAVITFDDGDIGLHRHLLPLLDAEKVPVTVYIATAQIETGTPYWFDKVMNALQSPEPVTIDLTHHGLKSWTIGPETGAARWTSISDLLETLKSVPWKNRDAITQDVLAQTKDLLPQNATALAPLSVDQLQELAKSPWVTIGAHSHCHSLLDQIPLSAVKNSLTQCKTLLEDWTGQEIRHFAYPNGNHSEDVRNVVKELGFTTATTLGMKLWRRGADTMAIPRIALGRYDRFERFKLRLVEY